MCAGGGACWCRLMTVAIHIDVNILFILTNRSDEDVQGKGDQAQQQHLKDGNQNEDLDETQRARPRQNV